MKEMSYVDARICRLVLILFASNVKTSQLHTWGNCIVQVSSRTLMNVYVPNAAHLMSLEAIPAQKDDRGRPRIAKACRSNRAGAGSHVS